MLSVPKSINEIQKRDIYQITKGANSIFKEMNLKYLRERSFRVDPSNWICLCMSFGSPKTSF